MNLFLISVKVSNLIFFFRTMEHSILCCFVVGAKSSYKSQAYFILLD